jgi:outer membrane protein assembly factor BamA
MKRVSICLAAVVLACMAGTAWALGEVITDIRIQGNSRTHEPTIRSIAGIAVGDVLEASTLEVVRERLSTSGLFAKANVYWEPHQEGVRVVITIQDKFPWAPVPLLSFAPGDFSAGLIWVHGNLWGLGKRGVLGGRYSNATSGVLAVYEDPALFGTWLFWGARARYQDMVLPEFANRNDLEGLRLIPVRSSQTRSFGAEAELGVAWFRKVRTAVGFFADTYDLRRSKVHPQMSHVPVVLPAPAEDLTRAGVSASLTFDFRTRDHAIMYGNALSFGLDYGAPRFGSDDKVEYWKGSVSYDHGIRFFRRHNLQLRLAAYAGKNLPFWSESSTSGNNLRGFVYRQFAGDTHLRSQVEYHFPLFSVGPIDLRGLFFNDGAAIWYRNLPPQVGDSYETRRDGRQFLPPSLLVPGFDPARDTHASFGAGLRFYLRTVSVPLVGIDVGHGLGTGAVRMVIVVGS